MNFVKNEILKMWISWKWYLHKTYLLGINQVLMLNGSGFSNVGHAVSNLIFFLAEKDTGAFFLSSPFPRIIIFQRRTTKKQWVNKTNYRKIAKMFSKYYSSCRNSARDNCGEGVLLWWAAKGCGRTMRAAGSVLVCGPTVLTDLTAVGWWWPACWSSSESESEPLGRGHLKTKSVTKKTCKMKRKIRKNWKSILLPWKRKFRPPSRPSVHD